MKIPQTKEAIREELDFYIDALEELLGVKELPLTREESEVAGESIYAIRRGIEELWMNI